MAAKVRLREVLESGEVAYGATVDTFSPAIAEVAGLAGLDFIRIDTEYAWRRDEGLEHMIRACRLVGLSPLVRVEKGLPYLVSKALQAGADAVLVSDITSYDEAAKVVEAAHFAPRGTRGYNTFTPAGRWGTEGGKEWVEWSDDNLMVGVMIENEGALADVDRILAIDGLDYCLFGPSDYSMSLGYREPRKTDAKVQAAMKKVCETCDKHGKWASIPLGSPFEEQVAHYKELGFKMLEIGHDVSILSMVWSEVLGKVKAK